jgi:pilus assembly protein Flp/PilA
MSKGEKMRNFMLELYTKAQMLREDHGQDLIEYALLAALIAVACVAAFNTLATKLNTVFASVTAAL